MLTRLASERVLAFTLGLSVLVLAASVAAGPATRPAATQPTPPSAEQVLKEVLQDRSQGRPLLPTEPGMPVRAVASEEAGAATQPTRLIMMEGEFLKLRGRLVRDAAWWTLVPEGVGQSTSPAQPIRLLPNRMLEMMEQVSAGGTRPVLFSVSGQVTEYRATNYLLAAHVMVEHDHGNLSK